MVSSRADRRLAGVALALAAAMLALAGAAWPQSHGTTRTARIVKGTEGRDVLRGGGRADILEGLGGNDSLYGRPGDDRLYGGAGNDRLFGGPGDDKLAGGPGADRFSCGRGRDVVYTSSAGRVSRDCEIVHRTKGGPPVGLVGGAYRGDVVGFQLASDLKTLSSLTVDFQGQCPSGTSTRIQLAESGPFGVQPGNTFAVDEQGGDGVTLKLRGAIHTGGVANGTFELQSGACDTGNVSWTATRRG
jgi:RTX calcium-binding nonapeptide repeat (4 copies)